jgi:hypothetical protein
MKLTSNIIRKSALLVTITTATLLPMQVFALGNGTVAVTVESPFCKNLGTTTSKVTTTLTDLVKKHTDAEATRDQKIAANRTKWDQELAANRAKWDTQRTDNFTKLQAKATTDDQKAAAATYVDTVKAAITARRSANDSARSAFRAGVDAAIATRRTQVSAQSDTFTSSVNTDIAAAQSTCASDSKSTVARETFKTSMKTTRTTFMADRAGDDKVTTVVAELVKTRDTTIKTNDDSFKAKTAAARNELKVSFKGKEI